jgi:hypothetical protein
MIKSPEELVILNCAIEAVNRESLLICIYVDSEAAQAFA